MKAWLHNNLSGNPVVIKVLLECLKIWGFVAFEKHLQYYIVLNEVVVSSVQNIGFNDGKNVAPSSE